MIQQTVKPKTQQDLQAIVKPDTRRIDGAKEFDNRFKILDDKAYDEEIGYDILSIEKPKQIFQKLLRLECENIEYLLKLKRYILDYYVDDYRIRMNKKGNPEYEKPYTSLDGTQVRSKSERYIADWMYIHNIGLLHNEVSKLL